MTKNRTLVRCTSLLALVILSLSACQADATDPTGNIEPIPTEPFFESDGMLPEANPIVLEGEINIAGSSTVFPLAEAMASRFEAEGFDIHGNISIASVGSGAGFERFCTSGETDIATASRAIKDEEVEACRSIGREPIEFRVGTDAIVATVSKENDFLHDITIEELSHIFSSDATTWADVNPDWPNQRIRRYSPGTDSGTFDFFVEEVMEAEYGEEGRRKMLTAENLNLSEDDNNLVQGIVGSPYAIGYFGYAYFLENRENLRALVLNSVSPTEEATESGEYPLSRPLYLYSDAGIMREKLQVAGFINFFITWVNEEITDVGYFPASEEALNDARQKWLDAMNWGSSATSAVCREQCKPYFLQTALNPKEPQLG